MVKRKRSAIGPWAGGYGKRRKVALVKAPPKSKFKLTKSNNVSIFPKKLRQTLVYAEHFELLTGDVANIPAQRNFRMNGLYDPRADLQGHQPYGFDQLMAIYKRFTCLGAKITVHFAVSESEYYSCIGGVNVANTAEVLTSVDKGIESQFSSYVVFTQNSEPGICKLGLDMAKYFGVVDVMDDPHLSGSDATDPARQAIGTVWVSSNTALATVRATVKIEYDTVFTEPKEVATS